MEKKREVSKEERTKILHSCRIALGYAMLLRWSYSLREYAVKERSSVHRIYDVDSGYSGRFGFYMEDKKFFLLAQEFEIQWLGRIPWNYAVFHEQPLTFGTERKIYLVSKGTALCGVRFPPLALGLDVGIPQFGFIQSNKPILPPREQYLLEMGLRHGWVKVDYKPSEFYIQEMFVHPPPPNTFCRPMPEVYKPGSVLPLLGLSINRSPQFSEIVNEERQHAFRDYAEALKNLLRKLPENIGKRFAMQYGTQDKKLLMEFGAAVVALEFPDAADPEGEQEATPKN